MQNPKQTIAAFDFDGTITYCDSLIPFFSYTLGLPATLGKMTLEIPHLLGYVLKQTSRQEIKECLLKRFFAGAPAADVQEKGKEFAETHLQSFIKPKALERIRWHQKRGHQCILVSANLDLYLAPWAEKMGFHHAITSQCEISPSGRLTGKLLGENCRGPEKLHRLTHLLGPKENYTLYAYGDSSGDRDLLNAADYAYYRVF